MINFGSAAGSVCAITSIPSPSRNAVKAANSPSPNSSATVLTGLRLRQAQAPARSQLPLCGSTTTAPGPARAARRASSLIKVTRRSI